MFRGGGGNWCRKKSQDLYYLYMSCSRGGEWDLMSLTRLDIYLSMLPAHVVRKVVGNLISPASVGIRVTTTTRTEGSPRLIWLLCSMPMRGASFKCRKSDCRCVESVPNKKGSFFWSEWILMFQMIWLWRSNRVGVLMIVGTSVAFWYCSHVSKLRCALGHWDVKRKAAIVGMCSCKHSATTAWS